MAEVPEQLKEHAWQPGQSGNPKGRPKRPTFEMLVAQILDETIPDTDWTKREALARVFVDQMLHKNSAMMKEYLTREWAVVQRHELTGSDGGPIEVTSEDGWAAFASALPRVKEGSPSARGNGPDTTAKSGNGPA